MSDEGRTTFDIQHCVKAQKSDNTYTNYFKSNVITVPTVDRTPPVIITPSPTSFITTNSSGGVVNYPITATDATDGTVNVSCNPSPGTSFPVGNTIVTCRATDDSGNTATARFTITLTYSETCSSDSNRESRSICLAVASTLPNDSRYIYGGQEIYTNNIYSENGKLYTEDTQSTATIGAEHKNGTDVLVMLAHVVPLDNHHLGESNAIFIYVNQNKTFITERGLRGFYLHHGANLIADALYAILLDGFEAKKDQVITENGTKIKIIAKGGLYNYGKYPWVNMLGTQTNSEANVSYMNVSVSDPRGILRDQALSRYNSSNGDSGAPVIYYHQNGTASLFGIHVGKLCTASFYGETPPPTFVDRNCRHRNLDMTVFSPWENVRSFLSLK